MEETLARDGTAVDLLESAYDRQVVFETEGCDAARKSKGQFFTPPAVARFMAAQFDDIPKRFRLLDPGAGTGALTLAVCQRLLESQTSHQLDVHLFETDPEVLPVLRDNLHQAAMALQEAGHQLNYVVDERDFILDVDGHHVKTLFSNERNLPEFDGVITNPPYFKINKQSEYARVMSDVVHGQPNIYSLFLAQAAMMLRDGGELVAITPRSFCNGLYFREFRKWLLSRVSLENVHLFGSRTGTFLEANVLQESIITRLKKSQEQATSISVSRTPSRDFSNLESQNIAANKIIDDSCGEMLIYVPETSVDADIVEFAEAWPARFSDVGLKISTGPVVMFRAKEFLVDEPNGETVPLLSAHNVKPFRVLWPVEKKKWPLAFRKCPRSQKHLVATRNYVLIKRFSSKEEKRRLTAGCLFADSMQNSVVALENHLNYVYHADRDLTIHEMFGVAALFNSVVFDRYFRCFSGNTQVNATEVRTMKFPELQTIVRIGKKIGRLSEISRSETEEIVLGELNIGGKLRDYILGMVH